jgi:hypothetical protein
MERYDPGGLQRVACMPPGRRVRTLFERCFFLFFQPHIECCFHSVDVRLESGWIDKRIRHSLGELGVFFRKPVKRTVGSEEHIDWKRPQDFETAPVVLGNLGIVFVVDQDVAGINANAADDHDVIVSRSVSDLQCPCRATLGVSGRQPRYECHAAQLDLLTIPESLVDRMRFVLWPDVPERWDILLHHHHLCPSQFLDERIAGHVVAVSVAAQQDFDIGEAEPELVYLSVMFYRPAAFTTGNAKAYRAADFRTGRPHIELINKLV